MVPRSVLGEAKRGEAASLLPTLLVYRPFSRISITCWGVGVGGAKRGEAASLPQHSPTGSTNVREDQGWLAAAKPAPPTNPDLNEHKVAVGELVAWWRRAKRAPPPSNQFSDSYLVST